MQTKFTLPIFKTNSIYPPMFKRVRNLVGMSALLVFALTLLSASCQQSGCPNAITKEYKQESPSPDKEV
jgi:hypothetical protein